MRNAYDVKTVDTTNEELRDLLKQFMQRTHRQTVPYLFVDHRPVGGLDDIMALHHSGTLKRLVCGAL
jgi:glutaredoxin